MWTWRANKHWHGTTASMLNMQKRRWKRMLTASMDLGQVTRATTIPNSVFAAMTRANEYEAM